MITIMSPTKTFREIEESKTFKIDQLIFSEEVKMLMNQLNQYGVDELAQLMKMSDSLAEVNYKRNKYFHEDVFGAYPAMMYYYGDAFKELDASSLNEESIVFAQEHLRILSGLYGVLAPLDVIKEYRLEMATKLVNPISKDLYTYWKQKITSYLIEEVSQTTGDKVILNVASDEYAKAIDWGKIHQDFNSVTIVFKEKRGETYKVVGTYAKKARGKFIRYILKQKIDTVEGIKQFSQEGYSFNEELSNIETITFTR